VHVGHNTFARLTVLLELFLAKAVSEILKNNQVALAIFKLYLLVFDTNYDRNKLFLVQVQAVG
jgi:hypothetical protein